MALNSNFLQASLAFKFLFTIIAFSNFKAIVDEV